MFGQLIGQMTAELCSMIVLFIVWANKINSSLILQLIIVLIKLNRILQNPNSDSETKEINNFIP